VDVQRALRLLRRWWPVLLAGTLLAAGASYVVSKAQPRVYEATSLLRVNPGLPDIGGGGNFNEYQAAWSLATEDARLLQTMEVAQGALASTSSQLRHELDSGTLLKNTKATALPQQALVTLAIRASDPNDAQLLANAMSDTFVRRDAKQRSSAVLSLNDLRFMGSFDDAVVRSICGSNDENLCAWWVADVVATGHMNNRNGSGSGLAARDPSFWCRASSLTAMVGIVHGRSIVAAV